MDWRKLISAKRFGMEEFHEDRQENRSEFQRDYDRLVFSAPFRRLQNKTQVFPLPGSIFVHNRLTHSLEVSCVGRSLGNDVSKAILTRQPELYDSFLPEIGSIVSAACLAHDLGNPPFGHSGEKAISTFFSEGKGQFLNEQISPVEWDDLTHFEGNANAFRLLTHQFEGRRKGGFAMTYSTLASIVKYPFSSSLAGNKSKFGFFTSEEEGFRRIATELGLIQLNAHPLNLSEHAHLAALRERKGIIRVLQQHRAFFAKPLVIAVRKVIGFLFALRLGNIRRIHVVAVDGTLRTERHDDRLIKYPEGQNVYDDHQNHKRHRRYEPSLYTLE